MTATPPSAFVDQRDERRLARLVEALGSAESKQHRIGTDRVCSPATTVERVTSLATAVGITRIADVTRLDHVGIDVWCAIRPHSTNLAVSQGKGVDRTAAMASAIMESIEMWHAEQHHVSVIEASHDDLAATGATIIDVDRLERYHHAEGTPPADLDRHAVLRWTLGWDLLGNVATWVPYECVHCDGTLPLHPSESIFLRGSNGLASGNAPTEAILHALYEIIERDSQRQRIDSIADTSALFHSIDPDDPRRIDPDTIDDPNVRDIIERLRLADLDVGLYDVTGAQRVTTLVAILHTVPGSDSAWINTMPCAQGSGAHLDRNIAALRALTEAAQDRTTVIAGSRDDIPRIVYVDWAEESGAARRLLDVDPTVDFTTLGSAPSDDLGADLTTVLDRLRSVGVTQAVIVDLTLDDDRYTELTGLKGPSPAHVVCAVVPGMKFLELEPTPPMPLPEVPTDAPLHTALHLDAERLDATGIAVFAGPSVDLATGHELLDAAWLPPAECGDVWRAVRAGAHTIVLIDGRYASVPAPWHKEIMWALDRHVTVIGAASMGALRAAELHRYGMIPIGKIAADFIDGSIDGDDEVAVAHGDASTGWRQLNDALVDCRYQLADAVEHGLVTLDEANAIIGDLQRRFYPERDLFLAARTTLGPDRALTLREHTADRPRQKQLDALDALRRARDLATNVDIAIDPTRPITPAFRNTSAWGLIVRSESEWPDR